MERAFSKKELRKKLFLIRESLSNVACQEKSKELTNRFLVSQEFKMARVIHFYLSMNKEVQTDVMILEALKMGKRVIVPVVYPGDRSLSFSELSSLDPAQMEPGPFGIRQPRSSIKKNRSPREIDLWVVPGLGFDIQGRRIGYGGGYYDRVLREVRVKIIGLAFEFQVLSSVPVGEHDCPVDQIMTEKRTINCL